VQLQHGRIVGGDRLPGREALQQQGHPQGLQGSHPRREGHPQPVGLEGPAAGIEGGDPLVVVLGHQGEGLGGGEQPAQP
jgi:hypothetical protein